VPDTQAKKLLTINFGGIGDEILFLPTLAAARKRYPNWHITLLLEPRSRSAAQVTNLIDDVITFDIKKRPLLFSDLMDLLGLIKSGGYDVVLSSGSSPMVSILLFLSGIRQRIGYDAGRPFSHLLTNAIPLNQQQYAVNMYHDLSAGLGVDEPAGQPSIVVPPESLARMQDFLKSRTSGATQNHKVILLHPGTSKMAVSKGLIKTWPPLFWAELIRRLSTPQHQVVLAGGPDDADTISEIMDALGNAEDDYVREALVSAFGITRDLSDLAALIDLSDLLICVDSAPMHLGVALDKNLVALFGPTNPDRLLPSNPKFAVLKDNAPTPSGLTIPVSSVYEAAMSRLSQLVAAN